MGHRDGAAAALAAVIPGAGLLCPALYTTSQLVPDVAVCHVAGAVCLLQQTLNLLDTHLEAGPVLGQLHQSEWVTRSRDGVSASASKSSIRRFVITEKAPTRAFSWLKEATTTTAFTFKTLLRHYAKRALTPRSLNVKLVPQRNYHKGRAAIRH